MRALIVGAILFLLDLQCAYGQASKGAPTNTSDIVCWQEGRKLLWADFQAKVKPNVPAEEILPNMTVGAVTEANVMVYDKMQSGVSTGVIVRVEFSKSKSWVDNSGKPFKEYILAHEQVHFDIEELTARRIRKVLIEDAVGGKPLNGPETTAAIDCLYQEGSDLQNLYDEETRSGNEPFEQVRWMDIIAHDLKQLAQYRSTAADCSLY